MEQKDIDKLRQLIRSQRWAALATIKNGEPYCSMVAYACTADLSSLILHLSTLAPHTQRLLKNPAISIGITEPDSAVDDPQTLARATLTGTVKQISTAEENYDEYRQRYLARLPNSEMLFDFTDFSLFEFTPQKIRYVGGFARAHSISPEQLKEPTKST